MSEATWLQGDVFERMAELPDGSVDLIVTSPPFLALRSYLPADHPDKGKEIGSEATPAAFLSTLLALTREWRRLLAPHGSLCVELGDTYSGSGGAGGDYADDGLRAGQEKFSGSASRGRLSTYDDKRGNPDGMRDTTFSGANTRTGGGRGWPLAKSLCLLPTLYPASLAYGRNLLDPDDTLDPWRIRNLIVWHRPNPPVGALGDKVRPSTSYVTTACVSDRRWFDLDAERTEHKADPARYSGNGYSKGNPEGIPGNEAMPGNPAGAPPLDCWTIPTAPYAGSHYATFPPALPRKLINLMCPRQVCVVCGEPRRRDYGELRLDDFRTSTRPQTIRAVQLADQHELTDHHIRCIAAVGIADTGKARLLQTARNFPATWDTAMQAKRVLGGYFREFTYTTHITRRSGWTDCGHDHYRRGIVLDPFAGSGTTLMAASELGRDSIGIDLDERNFELARERCGMFLAEGATA